mgnify:CR=1 FL=1
MFSWRLSKEETLHLVDEEEDEEDDDDDETFKVERNAKLREDDDDEDEDKMFKLEIRRKWW